MLAALPGRKKYFSTQRLVPQNFLPTKNEMIKQGKLTLAADWEVLVKSQESFSKKKWIVSSDATWRHMNVRIQFKTKTHFLCSAKGWVLAIASGGDLLTLRVTYPSSLPTTWV